MHSANEYIALLIFIITGYFAIKLVASKKEPLISIFVVILTFLSIQNYGFIKSLNPNKIFILSIGLSFLLFRIIHLIISSNSNEIKKISFVDYLSYILYFPTYLSGPFQNFKDYEASFVREEINYPENLFNLITGYILTFVIGPILFSFFVFFKSKLPQDLFSATPNLHQLKNLSIASICYSLYLYANFSGYTNIVRSISAIFFGIRLPINFNYPLSSTSFIEFWTRWHISLADWFKTYFYNPLLRWLLVRLDKYDLNLNFINLVALSATFFTMGFWHGGNNKFALYGLLLMVGITTNKSCSALIKRIPKNLAINSILRSMTFGYFSTCLLMFWINIPSKGYFNTMAAIPFIFLLNILLLFVPYIVGTKIYNFTHRYFYDVKKFLINPYTLAIVTFITALLIFCIDGDSDFVYKQF
jgi:D-alanyl-lipoteichoic acid acyltransferase DltB (MBOAT superfamily)